MSTQIHTDHLEITVHAIWHRDTNLILAAVKTILANSRATTAEKCILLCRFRFLSNVQYNSLEATFYIRFLHISDFFFFLQLPCCEDASFGNNATERHRATTFTHICFVSPLQKTQQN